MRKGTLTLRKRMFVLICGTVYLLIAALLVCFSAYSSLRFIQQEIRVSEQKLTVIAQKLDMLTDNVADTAVFVLADDQVQTVLSGTVKGTQQNYLSMVNYLYTMASMDYISNIVLFPKDAADVRYALFSYGDPQERLVIDAFLEGEASEQWYMNTGVQFLPNTLADAQAKSPYMLTYMRKVYDKWTVRLLGAVSIMTNEASVCALYEDIPLGQNGWFAALDQTGRVISCKDKGLLGTDMSHLLRTPDGGRVMALEGVDSLVMTLPYERLGWTLVGVVPIAQITAGNRVLVLFTLMIGVCAALVTLVVAGWLSNNMSRPIMQLREAVERAGDGHRDLDVALERRDEIGDLNRAFVHMLSETDQLTRRIIDANNRQKEAELSILMTQLSPHFLYNSLECICGLSALGKNQDVITATTELARFYRSVFSGQGKLTSVASELEMVRRYFNIIQFRYPGRLSYTVDCDPDVEECLIVKLTTQPLIENAVIHGLRDSRRPWEVEIHAGRSNGDVCISVWDNGVGMSAETVQTILSADSTLNSRVHFGLRATSERIRLICGEGYGLSIYSNLGKGTMIVANFPADLREGDERV